VWDEPVEQQYVARSHRHDAPFTVRQRPLRNPEVPVVASFVRTRRVPRAWHHFQGAAVLVDVR
jgi:hypothetical protein